jgi:60 kDa SS-A/Ro ribonucleoprotein
MTLAQHVQSTQREPILRRKAAMAQNNAGGFAFQIDPWDRLHRFLVLGTEGGTYYQDERGLTRENASTVVLDLIREDGLRVLEETVAISEAARAPSNNPALFTMALLISFGDEETRRATAEALPRVARTFTNLAYFIRCIEEDNLRGWGRVLRRAVAGWYERPAAQVAYQVAKYPRRHRKAHHDLLNVAHPRPQCEAQQALFRYIIEGEVGEALPELLVARERAMATDDPSKVARLIEKHGLTREMVPNEALRHPEVWEALLYTGSGMPMFALLRNLATMTRLGLLAPFSDAAEYVAERLTDDDYWNRDWSESRFKPPHPLNVLVALQTYKAGQSEYSDAQWEPVGQVVDALDAAFYKAFGPVEPTGLRTMLALDVSGSMTWEVAGMPISCRKASAAMAMVTARTEPHYDVVAFSAKSLHHYGIKSVPITSRQRLDDVVDHVSRMTAGGTDCALPMLYALDHELEVDLFVVYTDNETWAGDVHPSKALQQYRQVNPAARLVVVGMTATDFSIADPQDPGMLDVVGFDTATPQAITAWATT